MKRIEQYAYDNNGYNTQVILCKFCGIFYRAERVIGIRHFDNKILPLSNPGRFCASKIRDHDGYYTALEDRRYPLISRA